MKKNIFDTFLEKVFDFPLWVKQIFYLRLYKNLENVLSEDFITTNEDDLFHLYVPDLTFTGKSEFNEQKSGFDANVYNFMGGVEQGLSMLEISMNNFWTMEEVAKFFVLCLEQNYIKTPKSKYVEAMAGFMSGKYRTGEYFKHTGKITVDQLQDVLVKQKEYAAQGQPKKMAELMISLGLITEKDCHSLLILKEEAKKRFILDTSLVPELKSADNEMSSEKEESYKKQIVKLQEQNKTLIEQQKKVLEFVKKMQNK